MAHHWDRRSNSDLPLSLYLKEIREDSLLTAEQEAQLAHAIADGDLDARARMIRSNLRLVVSIATQYYGCGMTLDDLIGEGNLGLIRATQEFDPTVGVRFSTYAAHWIRQAIRQALTNTTATIRLPAHMVGMIGRWRKKERSLERTLGRPPQFEEVAASLELTQTQVDMVKSALRAKRIHQEPSDDGENPHRHDVATSEDSAPELILETREEQEQLRRRLDRLEPRERLIIELRYGLNGKPAMTLKQIGLELNVTREWVRKLELKALRQISDDPKVAAKPARTSSRFQLARTA